MVQEFTRIVTRAKHIAGVFSTHLKLLQLSSMHEVLCPLPNSTNQCLYCKNWSHTRKKRKKKKLIIHSPFYEALKILKYCLKTV